MNGTVNDMLELQAFIFGTGDQLLMVMDLGIEDFLNCLQSVTIEVSLVCELLWAHCFLWGGDRCKDIEVHQLCMIFGSSGPQFAHAGARESGCWPLAQPSLYAK